ncbi:MAG: acylglycerol kinase family protein, partial [Methyloceanibacter sp.]
MRGNGPTWRGNEGCRPSRRVRAVRCDRGRCGGDGTVHDVAAGLLGTPVPLGIIPTGTANVFAREVGLPRSPERVAATLMNGR